MATNRNSVLYARVTPKNKEFIMRLASKRTRQEGKPISEAFVIDEIIECARLESLSKKQDDLKEITDASIQRQPELSSQQVH